MRYAAASGLSHDNPVENRMLSNSSSPVSSSDNRVGVKRRSFLQAATALAGVSQAISPAKAGTQQAGQAVAASTSKARLTVEDVYARAREALYPICRVCPQCDGVVCAGEFPGLGGVGSGMSFQNNFQALKSVELKLRTLTDVAAVEKKPDTSVTIFGQKLSLPAIAAPVGGLRNMGNRMPADAYFDSIVGGCVDAGTAGGIGDEPTAPDMLKIRCDIIARYRGKALVCLKPRPNPNFIKVLPIVEAAGTFMIAIDVDSAARYAGQAPEVMVGTKTAAQLRELVRATRIPIVLKGIMTPDEAMLAGEAGAAGIVVSNHGGRVLDHTPGTADVLPAIADKVKGKMAIFVDGCVHYGVDVLKYLALGADAVLVGRHLIRAAFGGGREGVALFMNTMRDELESAMVLTGVSNVQKITRHIIA